MGIVSPYAIKLRTAVEPGEVIYHRVTFFDYAGHVNEVVEYQFRVS